MTLNKQNTRLTARALLAGGAVGFGLALGATAASANPLTGCTDVNGNTTCQQVTIQADVPGSCELEAFAQSTLSIDVSNGQLSGASTTANLSCNTRSSIQLGSVKGGMMHPAVGTAVENNMLQNTAFALEFDYEAIITSASGDTLTTFNTADSEEPGVLSTSEEAFDKDTAVPNTTLTLAVTPQQPQGTLQPGTYSDTLMVVITPQ